MKRGILWFILTINIANLNAQSITPFTVNIAGFTVTKTVLLKIDESVFILTGDEFSTLYNNYLLDVEGLWNNYN